MRVGYVVGLDEIGQTQIAEVGGKGANLGELTRAGLPVPPGFVLTADAYLGAMEQGGVRRELDDTSEAVDIDDATDLPATGEATSIARLRSVR